MTGGGLRAVPLWAWLLIALVFYAASEYWSKLWSINGSTWTAVLVFVGYSVTTVCWLGIMAHRSQLLLMSVSWQVVGAILAAFVGVGLFAEKLSVLQWVGVAVGMLSTVLMLFGSEP